MFCNWVANCGCIGNVPQNVPYNVPQKGTLKGTKQKSIVKVSEGIVKSTVKVQ